MTHGDGDGWVGCGQDHRHWGRHGAAGLLIWAPDGSGRPLVLLIRRAGWSHHGDTWGPPGGARDSHETPAEAAVREAAEECGAPAGLVRISALLDDDHGGWSYQTLIGQAAEPFTVRPSREATETAWIPADDVAWLPDGSGAALDRWYPRFVLVVEGKTRAVLGRVPADGAVPVVAAPAEGDDTIADLAGRLPGRRFVVTADRELRRRCEAAGAAVAGPRWLTALLAGSAHRV